MAMLQEVSVVSQLRLELLGSAGQRGPARAETLEGSSQAGRAGGAARLRSVPPGMEEDPSRDPRGEALLPPGHQLNLWGSVDWI
jgi:hypothetical protein